MPLTGVMSQALAQVTTERREATRAGLVRSVQAGYSLGKNWVETGGV